MLSLLAASLLNRGEDKFDTAMKVFDGIRLPEERLKVLEFFQGRGGDWDEEVLLGRLATLPAGTQRTNLIGLFSDRLALRDVVKAISVAKLSECLEIRSILLEDILPRATEPDVLAGALQLAAALPEEWRSARLSRCAHEAMARKDPAAWWKENAAHGFFDPILVDSANIALKRMIATDPDSALRAWLASGPAPASYAMQDPMAERFLLPLLLAGEVPEEMIVRPSDSLIEAGVSVWVGKDPAAANRTGFRRCPRPRARPARSPRARTSGPASRPGRPRQRHAGTPISRHRGTGGQPREKHRRHRSGFAKQQRG